MSLNSISIKNFRVFNGNFEFDLATITILTGTNSSGKSSLTKALQMLKNTVGEKQKNDNPFFNFLSLRSQPDLNLGHFDYWLNDKITEDKTISFSFPFYFINVLDEYCIEFIYGKGNVVIPDGKLLKIRIFNKKSKEEIFHIDQTSSHFGFKALWSKINDFQDFQIKTHQFVSKIQARFSEFVWSDDNGGDRPSNLVLHFLHGNRSTYDSEGIFTFTYEMFLELLNEDERREFFFLRDVYEKSSSSLYFHDHDNFSYFDLIPLIHTINNIAPIYTYDVVNRPSKEENGAFVNVEFDEQDEYKKKLRDIRSTQKVFSEDEMKILDQLREIEIETLDELFGNREDFESLLLFTMNKVSDYFDKFMRKSIKLDIYENGSWHGGLFRSSDFEQKLLLKKLNGIDFPISWILERENEENFCMAYKGQYNRDNRNNILRIAVKSITKNIENIFNCFREVYVIPANRNTMVDRYYSMKEKSNYFAQTLAEIFQSISDTYFWERVISRSNITIQNLGIAEKLSIEIAEDGTTTSFYLVNKDNKAINLADQGHGINQLIPIVVKVSYLIESALQNNMEEHAKEKEETPFPIIVIEEPESNLHPALQSKLADMLVSLSQYDVRIIVETHSEYLIRKLQYLTAKGDVDPSKTQIYYFFPPDDVPNGEKQVRKINIDENGILTNDFGPGFFDEADKIAMTLWSMNQSQKN